MFTWACFWTWSKWTHAIWILLYLAFFTQNKVSGVHVFVCDCSLFISLLSYYIMWLCHNWPIPLWMGFGLELSWIICYEHSCVCLRLAFLSVIYLGVELRVTIMFIFNLSGVQTCSPKDCPIYVNSVGQFLLFHILNKLGIVRFLSFYSFK